MEYIERILDLRPLLSSRSLFLFGPRQCGKSTYIKLQLNLPVSASFNLLDHSLFLKLSQNPSQIRQEAVANHWQNGLIVIDEIQRIPELLNEVHLLIEDMNIHFLLTGSSARKLKRSGLNLLGGRARIRHMHPLVSAELKEKFDLEKAMFCGTIPFHYFSDLPEEDLQAYIGLYLTEEIAAEGVTRNIPAFARFLEVAAACNTQMINFTSVASDAQVKRQTVQNYFQVLVDTLLGFYLPPFEESVKRKAIGTPKFYFFDMGVVRSLRKLNKIVRNSSDFGEFFEHFIFLELRSFVSYKSPSTELSYWRSLSGFEVDFLVGKELAIEVKASSQISEKHLKGLKALQEENLVKKSIIICWEDTKRKQGDIFIYPWVVFLKELWAGELI